MGSWTLWNTTQSYQFVILRGGYDKYDSVHHQDTFSPAPPPETIVDIAGFRVPRTQMLLLIIPLVLLIAILILLVAMVILRRKLTRLIKRQMRLQEASRRVLANRLFADSNSNYYATEPTRKAGVRGQAQVHGRDRETMSMRNDNEDVNYADIVVGRRVVDTV